ncbi:hypothetical protein BDW66DRAFT_146324 [Aspergillus desertorum]
MLDSPLGVDGSVTITIRNHSDLTLRWRDSTLKDGEWGVWPIDTIFPQQYITCDCKSSGFIKRGADGHVTYWADENRHAYLSVDFVSKDRIATANAQWINSPSDWKVEITKSHDKSHSHLSIEVVVKASTRPHFDDIPFDILGGGPGPQR